MKILYISQYYPPEIGAPSARVSELSREWAKRGHEVTVLTAFPHHPHGKKRPEDRFVLTRREKDGEVEIVRTYVFAAKNKGFLLRVVSYVSFMLSAILIGTWRVGKPDVVIATSPQLFTAVAGWWISFVRRAPFIFEVRDLWPESIVIVGAMKDSFVIRMLKGLADWLYRSADRIVTVGPGYRRRILANYNVPAEKIDVVTNGVDLSLYSLRDDDRRSYREKLNVTSETVVLYLGTHGMAHGLEFVLDAAWRLREKMVRFVFVGDGAEKESLIEQAGRMELQNVSFVPAQDKSAVVGYYAASDVCLVPLRKVDLFTDVLPSKLFEVMGMSRPIVISVDGDARQEVERARAGIFVEPECVDGLCAAIEKLHEDPILRQSLGASGRRYVEERYRRGVLARQYADLLDQVVREKAASADAVAVR